jgi:endonuclease/exonuclease/phosphatase family metal-dependent hydrolase
VEKKIAFLSERRTALSQQRERSYEEMATLEAQEAQMKRQFGEATGTITKKRVTTQLLQLRKDLERRQQLLSVLNQQVDVVSTHLHNLELVQQGQTAKLPDAEEMTADAVKAEEMLAELEAESELAASIGQTGGIAGLNAEEQALYEELERETNPGKAATATASTSKPVQKQDEPARPQTSSPVPQRRGEAEPG